MTLLSTKEDFLATSLRNIPGVLGKLRYVSQLRDDFGGYHHWGLIRIYGEEAVQRSVGEVHRALFLEVLRTPLRQLVEDLARSSAAEQDRPRPFLKALAQRSPSLIPPDVGGGSVAHFNSIVAALLSLLE